MTGMKSLKFQNAYLWQTQQLWFLLVVPITWISAFRDIDGDKTYNLKLGFDLTRGSQGASSLRIRNFEENEDAHNIQPALRAEPPQSSSASNEDNNTEKKKVIAKEVEMKAAADSAQSEESDDSGIDSKRSTKGLRADEFEPQGPEVREEFDEDTDSANSN